MSVALSSTTYDFEEDIGQANLFLTLDGPIQCCSVSVAVKFESGTAKGINVPTHYLVCIILLIN